MNKEDKFEELNELITACCNGQGLELVDLICQNQGNKLALKVFADRAKGGITLGECALLNRQLKNLLEEKNIIDCDYVLETSSPGLDRSLKRSKDFLRCLNKEVVFFLNDSIGAKCQWQGLVKRADENSVFIDQSGQILEIPLIKINKAKLVI